MTKNRRAKETISIPTKREVKDASKELRKGHSAGGRVMAEMAAAARKKKL